MIFTILGIIVGFLVLGYISFSFVFGIYASAAFGFGFTLKDKIVLTIVGIVLLMFWDIYVINLPIEISLNIE